MGGLLEVKLPEGSIHPRLKEANRLLWDLPSYTSLKAASTGFTRLKRP